MFRRIKKAVKKKGRGVGTPSKAVVKAERPLTPTKEDSPIDVTHGISYYDESTDSEEKRSLDGSYVDENRMRGYSSGASSVASAESDHDLELIDGEPSKGRCDRVGLEDIRSSLLSCGEGGYNGVRMETPLGKPIEDVCT